MKLYGDYHTHTEYSHGKGSVLDNVQAAAEAGLKEVAIADHGFRHTVFGLSPKKVKRLTEDVKAARELYPGIKIILGVEANITGFDGSVDLKPHQWEWFDLVLAGYHKAAMPYNPRYLFGFHLKNQFNNQFKKKASDKLVTKNTNAVIKLIEKNPVDILTHINYCFPVLAEEVAKVCAAYGTYLELNSKRILLSSEETEEVLRTDAKFIISSDAHSPDRVGEFSLADKFTEEHNIPHARIVNIGDEPPVFRSQVSGHR